MSILYDLADKYKTDKRWQEHGYVMMYEKLMENKRMKTNKILEIGYGNGASVKMWADYFPNADIYCMEYCDDEYRSVWNSPKLDSENVEIIIGDSTKIESWENVPYNLDYIIDDGDHTPSSQISTFLNGFSHLASNGIYFIEDLHCGFERRYGSTDLVYKKFFDMIIQQQTPGKNYGGNFYQSRIAMPEIIKDIYSYQFFKSVIAIEKA